MQVRRFYDIFCVITPAQKVQRGDKKGVAISGKGSIITRVENLNWGAGNQIITFTGIYIVTSTPKMNKDSGAEINHCTSSETQLDIIHSGIFWKATTDTATLVRLRT